MSFDDSLGKLSRIDSTNFCAESLVCVGTDYLLAAILAPSIRDNWAGP